MRRTDQSMIGWYGRSALGLDAGATVRSGAKASPERQRRRCPSISGGPRFCHEHALAKPLQLSKLDIELDHGLTQNGQAAPNPTTHYNTPKNPLDQRPKAGVVTTQCCEV